MTLTMPATIGDVLKFSLDLNLVTEAVTLLSGVNYPAGAVLGKADVSVATNGVTAAAVAGNTGNGVCTPDATTPALAGCQFGVYTAVCIEPAANAGTFAVYDPAGVFIGRHVVAGAAFATQIKFAIADGATDFVAGDAFTFTVAAGTGKYTLAPNAAAISGIHRAVGVLLNGIDATAGDAVGTVLLRGPAVINAQALTYDSTVDDGTKKAAKLAQLAALDIIARTGI